MTAELTACLTLHFRVLFSILESCREQSDPKDWSAAVLHYPFLPSWTTQWSLGMWDETFLSSWTQMGRKEGKQEERVGWSW